MIIENMLNIVNVVITTELGMSLDLSDIANKLNAPYNPKKFNGVVHRIPNPKCTTLFLKNGTVICNLKIFEDIEKWQQVFLDLLKKIDIHKTAININIRNIVAAQDLGFSLNLTHLASELGFENVEYHPESFVGLVYKIPEYNATLMIFRTGKVNIVGTKTRDDAQFAFDKLKRELNID